MRSALDDLLPEYLWQLQRTTGFPVAFGAVAKESPRTKGLVITRISGAKAGSLRGIFVPSGRGLGGAALQRGVPLLVQDYATAETISHEFDHVVVTRERLGAMLAVPVVVDETVHGMLYGAAYAGAAVGDRVLRVASALSARLQQEIEARVCGGPRPGERRLDPLDELAEIIRSTADHVLRQRLSRVHQELATSDRQRHTVSLTVREVDVLQLVADGASNVVIAAQLALSPDTVKAYLRAAMTKLGVGDRTAAVRAARAAGFLQTSRDEHT